MSSKIKSSISSKRSRTQSIVNSAFDQSVIFIAVTKIQKCLYDISKSKYDKIHQAIKVVNRDINVISQDSKQKEKVTLLGIHLLVFEQINDKKYNEALDLINKKQSHTNQRTNPVLRLSIRLLKSLLLRFIQRQEESHKLLSEAINQVDLTGLKIKSKTLDYKILQATLICISIVADYFNQFQSHSQQFRSIYAKAYHISHKYLTQYHKLTETLYSICKKFPNQQKNHNSYKISTKRNSLAIDSNRSIIKRSKSDRASLDSSLRLKPVKDSSSQISQPKHNMKKAKPKRLKTLDPYIDIQQSKQKCLSKLYGIETTQSKVKQKKLLKRPKISTSLKTQNVHGQNTQMKDLQQITQIYLPKISPQRKKQEKLNAADILKYAMSLEKLKPNYFDKLSHNSQQKQISNKKDSRTPPTLEKQNPQLDKPSKSQNKTQKVNQNNQSQDNNNNVKTQKQQTFPPIKSQQVSPTKQDNGCQLI